MKLSRISFLFLLLFLLVPSVSYAQSAANKSWQPFWTKFSVAVKNKDLNTLRALSLQKLNFPGAEVEEKTLDEYFRLDKRQLNETWKSLAASVKSGTKIHDKVDGKLTRVTEDNWLTFVYTKNGWRWWGFMGD